MDINRFIELLELYLQNSAEEDEQQELFLMISSGKYDEQIKQRIDASFEEDESEIDPTKASEILTYILSHQPAPIIPIKRRNYWKYIAAACILIVTGYVLWVTVGRRSQVADNKEQVAKTNDVEAPKETRAVITLANGSKIYLDSAGNGVLAQENNVAVVRNADGSIEYNRKDAKTQSDIVYNTIFNPRGSKVISLTLSDGTKVWLNSESSLRYPASFAPSAVRDVEITGEAYFEVKHNSKQPFKVHLPNGSIVEDLGTAFNINSYSDEESIKTTLIEGAVRITAANAATAAVKLKPGEQSVISRTSPDHYITTSPDIEEVLAWKNDYFKFKSATTEEIMRQVGRWYDAEVVYEGNVKGERFGGSVPRSSNASQVLKVLELTKTVRFEIEGKKIIVKPYE